VQVTVQVEPPPQVTLPLSPTVTAQVEPPPQSMLQEAPHSPVHSLSFVQSRLQLSASHSLPPRSHASPAGQAHEVPVHSGGGTSPSSEPPHPDSKMQDAATDSVVREPRRMSDSRAEPHIGLLLPCNVVVQEADDSEMVVSIGDPKAMFTLVDNPAVAPVASEVDARLRRVLDALGTGGA